MFSALLKERCGKISNFVCYLSLSTFISVNVLLSIFWSRFLLLPWDTETSKKITPILKWIKSRLSAKLYFFSSPSDCWGSMAAQYHKILSRLFLFPSLSKVSWGIWTVSAMAQQEKKDFLPAAKQAGKNQLKF